MEVPSSNVLDTSFLVKAPRLSKCRRVLLARGRKRDPCPVSLCGHGNILWPTSTLPRRVLVRIFARIMNRRHHIKESMRPTIRAILVRANKNEL